jgi:hypothetical protein
MFGRWKKSDAADAAYQPTKRGPYKKLRGLWLLAYGTVLDYPRRYAATPYLP